MTNIEKLARLINAIDINGTMVIGGKGGDMTRELEQALWQHIAGLGSARDWIDDELRAGTIAHPKQAWRTLEKWAARGLYDYGVALDLGWLVDGAKIPDRKAA